MPPKGSRSKAKSKAVEHEVVDALLDAMSGNDSVSQDETATPKTRKVKRKAVQHDADTAAAAKKPKVAVHTTEVDIIPSSGKPTQHQMHRNVKLEIPLSSLATTKPTGKRIVFNNNDNDDNEEAEDDSPDGPSEFFTPQGSPTTATPTTAQQPKGGAQEEEEEDENDDDSDDDDAPEAVSTHTAAAQAAKSAQAAAHAAGRQREAERQKRQERDARLKSQAGSRKKQQTTEEEEAEGEGEGEGGEKARIIPASSSSSKPKRFTKNNLPDRLPDELLASDSESDDDEEEQRSRDEKRKPTVIKFNTVARLVAKAESRQPADQRVGSTVYRVMKKKGDERLAPKGGKYSRNAREDLLGRARAAGGVGSLSRRTTTTKKGGFLVKR